MDLRMMRYFLAIVDCGSVTAASKQLFVAQPSLSRQLRRFESSLGVQLFSRMDRRLVLTTAGRQFVPIARDLVARAAQAETMAAAIAAGAAPDLVVAAPTTTINDIVAPFIATGTRVSVANVIETQPADVYGAVTRGDADFGLGTSVPMRSLHAEVLIRVDVWAQVPEDHELATSEAVDLVDLVGFPLVHLDIGHSVRRAFDAVAADRGLTYDAIAQTRAPRLGQALAAAGRGVCVTSDDPRYGLSKARVLVDGAPLTVTLYAAWDQEHYASVDIEETIADLRAFTIARYGRDEDTPPA
ncbi:HTH-type transcriptional regulator CatM [Nocardioides dokdonensis FR1436]|uniref:HTH-type transcriptional regulator CatM n=1 Tax=Nocardioides dokdonensis FR1436 TaxID=1300347 RepID=A0A1A9GLV4_9ACTN|nr:LysR family transcriptional regulator [Nocardioides dokdonensis]ANH39269.1 HTH-type transcriptional regulator CatM [Nocardioides dokdonensis FR1436]